MKIMRRNKEFIIPIIAGPIFLMLYNLLPKLNIYFWLILMFSYGLWFSILVLVVIAQNASSINTSRSIIFCAFGIILYGLTFIYLSKDIEAFMDIRDITFLPFNGLGYFLLIRYLLRIKVTHYDYFLLLGYGFLINFFFAERPYNSIPLTLDKMLTLWISILLIHIVLISKRISKVSNYGSPHDEE